MSDGYSSGPVVYLTLAGPCPFLLVLVSYCLGWVRFFEILVFISLLSSISVDNSSLYCGQGDFGVWLDYLYALEIMVEHQMFVLFFSSL